jgi:hypothetical protein
MQMRTIVGIILVLLILVTLVSFWGSTLLKIGKSFLGYGDEILVEDKNILNNQAKNNFPNFINSITGCKASNLNQCGCDVSMNSYSDIHRFRISDKKILLETLNENSELTLASRNLAELNCYYTGDFNLENKDELIIQFNDEGGYIFLEDNSYGFLDDEFKIDQKYQLYKKDGKICWLTDAVSGDLIKNKSSCMRKT